MYTIYVHDTHAAVNTVMTHIRLFIMPFYNSYMRSVRIIQVSTDDA